MTLLESGRVFFNCIQCIQAPPRGKGIATLVLTRVPGVCMVVYGLKQTIHEIMTDNE